MFHKSNPSLPNRTRFNKTRELKRLHPILNELRQKEVELKTLVDNDAAHPIYMKSATLTNLTQQIDDIIFQFNSEPKPTEHRTEIIQLITLIAHLKNTIISTLLKHRAILDTARSTMKNITPQATTATVITSSLGVGFATGSFLFALAPLTAALALDYVAENIGFYNAPTATVSILEHLTKTLHTIDNSLRFVIKEFTINAIQDPKAFLCCPITLQRIQEPVLCTLDKRMYERRAITEWLRTKGTAPFNRVPLQPNQTIESVLIENISLRDALEEFEYMQIQPQALPSAPPEEEEDLTSKLKP